MGPIAPILPLYTISLGPLYHKILRPPLTCVCFLPSSAVKMQFSQASQTTNPRTCASTEKQQPRMKQLPYWRPWNSRARGIEKARKKKKQREETGERGRRRKRVVKEMITRSLSPRFPFFPAPPPFSRALHYLRAWNSLKSPG